MGVAGQPKDVAWTTGTMVALGLGYGCFLTYFPIGPLGTHFLTHLSSGWENILLSRTLFVLAAVAVIFGCRRLRIARIGGRRAAIRVSFSAALVATLLAPAIESLLPAGLAACCYEVALGGLTAIPKLYWYERLYELYRQCGRSKLLVCLALCFFVAAAFMPVARFMADVASSAASIVATIALSWACVETALSRAPLPQDTRPAPKLATNYRSSFFMKVVTASFGVTWGFSYTVAVNNGFGTSGSSTPSSSVMLAGIVLCSLLMFAFSRNKLAERMRFNEMLRWVIVGVAVVWAVMPLASDVVPALACFLCSAAYIFQSVLMILLIVEICDDYRMSVVSVTSSHYGRFIVSAAVSSLLYWGLFASLPAHIAYEVITAICVAATVACVPILPSRKSRAMVLAMDQLPEERSREEQLAESLEMVARSRSLTPRETEVMRLLVEGKTRGEIAETMCVSIWTIKNHIANVYGKVGAHSVPELVELLERGENRRGAPR